MIKGVFPRLFGNFREGAVLHAKFVVTNSGTPVFALKSAVGNANYGGIALAYDGTAGFAKITVSGGVRNMCVLQIEHLNLANPTDATKMLDPMQYVAISESTGVVKFKFVNDANPNAFADPVTADEVHVTLYVDK